MTQTEQSPAQGGASQQDGGMPAKSRAMTVALDLRERVIRRQRRRQRLFLGIVAGTMLATLAWGALVIPPRYTAEARFSVRGSSNAMAASGATGLLSGGSGGATGLGFVDGFAVNGFLQSRDCMLQLGKRVNLNELLDVKPAQGREAVYAAYRKAVSVKFNMVEQENVVAVSAFSPESSNLIAGNLLVLAQQFVSRMDSQGVQNVLDVDAMQLRKAEQDAVRASNAVAAWRAANRNIDPEAETQLVMTMIGEIEQELNKARINYEKIRAFNNDEHPLLNSARLQVAAMERQLSQARQRLSDGDNSQAAQLRTYTQLKNAETFALNNLTAAREAYQSAYRETARLRRYLSVIAHPVAEDRPSNPNLWLLALEGALGGVLLAMLTMLGMSLARTTQPS